MTEFLKGYAAGANDMEAGRLVTKDPTVDFALAQVRDRDLVIESLREQLARANWKADNAMAVHADLSSEATERLEAAEAKLAEVEEERDKTEEYAKEGWDWLSEALDALGAKTVFDIKARAASMDRARELAERGAKERNVEVLQSRLIQIARLLGGDDEPTTKGDT